MGRQIRQATTLLLGLILILGNDLTAYAHGGSSALGEQGAQVFQAGYISYFGFLIGGYLLMIWEVPQRLFRLLLGDTEERTRR